jgi:hypothetical protein
MAFEAISLVVCKVETTDFLSIAALDRTEWRQNRNSKFILGGGHVWRLWTEHALVFCAVINQNRLVLTRRYKAGNESNGVRQ